MIITQLPDDYRDLLMVSATDTRDVQGMLTINQAGADWLQGRMDTGTYFEVLDHFGVDPFTHIRPVEDLAYSTTFEISLLL